MISDSIETQIRGDEATRCGQLAEYRAMRITNGPRYRRSVPIESNFLGDIEMIDV